jgi:hypothetical protein
MEDVWYTLMPLGLFNGHSVYFVAIWYTLGMVIWHIFPLWYYVCTKKNLATLSPSQCGTHCEVARASGQRHVDVEVLTVFRNGRRNLRKRKSSVKKTETEIVS